MEFTLFMRQEKNFALQIVLQSQSTWLLFFFFNMDFTGRTSTISKNHLFSLFFLCDYTAIVEHLVAKRI